MDCSTAQKTVDTWIRWVQIIWCQDELDGAQAFCIDFTQYCRNKF
jgi:hypothetical protein